MILSQACRGAFNREFNLFGRSCKNRILAHAPRPPSSNAQFIAPGKSGSCLIHAWISGLVLCGKRDREDCAKEKDENAAGWILPPTTFHDSPWSRRSFRLSASSDMECIRFCSV